MAPSVSIDWTAIGLTRPVSLCSAACHMVSICILSTQSSREPWHPPSLCLREAIGVAVSLMNSFPTLLHSLYPGCGVPTWCHIPFSCSRITLSPWLIAVKFPQTIVHFAGEIRPSHESVSYSVPVAVPPLSSYHEWENCGENCSCLFFFIFLKHQLLLASTEGKRSADLSSLLHRENCLFSPPLPPVFSIRAPGVHAEDGGWIWVDIVPFTGMRP